MTTEAVKRPYHRRSSTTHGKINLDNVHPSIAALYPRTFCQPLAAFERQQAQAGDRVSWMAYGATVASVDAGGKAVNIELDEPLRNGASVVKVSRTEVRRLANTALDGSAIISPIYERERGAPTHSSSLSAS